MSFFRCRCGHIITDSTDRLPYKAYVRVDADGHDPVAALARMLGDFIEARSHGEQRAFLSTIYSPKWVDIVDQKDLVAIFDDLIDEFWYRFERCLYECEECGRIWIQRDDDIFVPYLSETDVRSILASRRPT